MSKFEKGIYDLLLKENEKNHFKENEIKEISSIEDEWLINQFSRELREKLEKLETLEAKIKFINDLSTSEKWTTLKAVKKDIEINNVDQISTNKLIFKNLWGELENEFETSNDIKMISPFISVNMVNKLRLILQSNQNIESLSIVTTTYDGTSKYLALPELRDLLGDFPDIISVKIENLFNSSSERLHMKSYLFNRPNNFSSLYIGSSNFTKTGLITGKEHNVRISEFKDKKMVDNFREQFENLINSNEFVDITSAEKINQIIMRQKLEDSYKKSADESIYENKENSDKKLQEKYEQTLVIKPYFYQEEIIKNVLRRIENNKNKHLLVMATGTGKTKTMMFIYEKLAELWKKEEPSLLYIAPSKEILDQSVNEFRNYFENEDFGLEFYDSRNNNALLENENIIFTNIETLNGRKDRILDKKFDVVVFDEAHHVEAATFKKIHEIVLPNTKQIFGLTATPERTDEINVKKYFDDEYASNIRLYEAIEKRLLCDFDYYFIKDISVDLKDIDIQKNDKLDKVLNINERHNFIYENIVKNIGSNAESIKAILFCNSINHSRDLSNFLNDKGLKSDFLVSENTSKNERNEKLYNFRRGKINFLCVRDILNEGLDIPEIDTVMFLRPTSSLLIYLQQLGRGLRKVTDKRLQIFDFVNNVNLRVNKKHNPLLFINALTSDLKINEFKKNINHLNKFLPGDSQFLISKLVKEDFLEKLKEYEKYNLYDSILSEYRTGFFEDYESFFNDKEIDIYDFYNNKKAFFQENKLNTNQTIIRQFIFFNSRELIEELKNILCKKKPSNNKLINKIFLVSFYHSPSSEKPYYFDLKIAFESIFDDKNKHIIEEIIFLLKYKLNNENLVNQKLSEEIISFRGICLNHNQLQALCSINIKDSHFKGKGVGGIISNNDDKIFAIDSSVGEISTKFKHGDFYDYENKILYWDSPNSWYFETEKISEQQKNMMNLKEYRSFVFLADKELVESKGEKAKVLIGEVTKIIDRVEVSNSDETKKRTKPRFILKID